MARVLVVEGGRTPVDETRSLLEAAGLIVDVVRDGAEALAVLGRGGAEVVVTDLHLSRPDRQGWIAAIRLTHPGVPVVLFADDGLSDVAVGAPRRGTADSLSRTDPGRDLASTLGAIAAHSASDLLGGRVEERLEEVRLRFAMASDTTLIAPLVRKIEGLVAGAGLCDPTGRTRLSVAVREALLNAIEHGNLELDSDLRQEDERAFHRLGVERRRLSPYRERRVHVEARVTRAEAVFRIRDEGPGFDPAVLPDPTDPANLVRIGGRGLLLIRAFVNEVRHEDGGRSIVLVKRAESHQETPRARCPGTRRALA